MGNVVPRARFHRLDGSVTCPRDRFHCNETCMQSFTANKIDESIHSIFFNKIRWLFWPLYFWAPVLPYSVLCIMLPGQQQLGQGIAEVSADIHPPCKQFGSGWLAGSSLLKVEPAKALAAGTELNSWQAQVCPRKRPVFCWLTPTKPLATYYKNI